MAPRVCWSFSLLLLGACLAEAPISPRDPDVRIVDPQPWQHDDLRLVSSDFAAATSLSVIVDDTLVLSLSSADSAASWWHSRVVRAGRDTLVVRCTRTCGPGRHSIAVVVDGVRVPPLSFEVHGFTTAGTWSGETPPLPLVSRPLSLGHGSSKFWVGTARGLALLDARWPLVQPVLVDSTVDPACLASIGAAADGAVVVADRGCGTLRVRRYGVTTVDEDSGPPAAGWRHALNHPTGTWLLDSRDTVALAVRGPGGAWTWSRWAHLWWYESILARSPDGRLAVAAGESRGAMVFDLEHAALLYRDSAAGRAVAFSPSSDTLVYFADSSLVLLDSRTGRRLAAFAIPRYGEMFPPSTQVPMVWDPFRPWLYLYADGCPVIVVFDRRTWTFAGWSGGHEDYSGACDGAMAPSGFEQTGWVLYNYGLAYSDPVYVSTFTIPNP